MKPEQVTELNNLLEAERNALLAGDLEGLRALLESKEKLMQIMNAGAETNLPDMQMLNQKLCRNQELLSGAMEGIRAVSTRFAKLRDVKGALATYGADGRRHDILPVAETSVERRA